MLRYTVAPKRRWLTIDPLSGITLPRKQVTVEQIYLTYAKVENLAEEADKINPAISSTLVRFLAYVGPRIGEATALRVSDMDFEKRRASVLRTWKEDDKGKPVLGSSKTWERRRVAIPRFLVVPLKRVCSGLPPDVFVFLSYLGSRYISLGHTFASLSIAAGADVKTVQNTWNHADASIL